MGTTKFRDLDKESQNRVRERMRHVTGQHEHVMQFLQICVDMEVGRHQWITHLRSLGVKAAHPDDGWVDRQSNYVRFINPHYKDRVAIGDTIAIGDEQSYRLVKCDRIVCGAYYFSDVTNT